MINELQGQIAVGMKVETLDGGKLGHVKAVHGDAFEIEKGIFLEREQEVAFSEIARIQDGVAVLSLTADALKAMRAPGEVGTAFRDRAEGVVDHAVAAIEDAVHAGSHPPKPSKG